MSLKVVVNNMTDKDRVVKMLAKILLKKWKARDEKKLEAKKSGYNSK